MTLTIPVISTLLLLAVVLRSLVWPCLAETFSPLRKLPGPFLARFSRLWYLKKVSTGQFHFINIDLHKTYGPIVRIAPGQYSINDPEAIKQIYGIGKNYLKSRWYDASSVPNAPWKDLFTDLDAIRHATNRRLVANLYSATSLRSMEPEVEDCIKQYMTQLKSLAQSGVPLDLQFWMQCYAFDVISQITLGRRFGFLDSGTDRGGIFASLHEYLKYCAVVGVENEWHNTLFWIMSKLPARGLVHVGGFTAEQIAKGKETRKKSSTDSLASRQDFLSKLFRLQNDNPAKFPDSAVFTTCVTNIGAGSDTTSISLCAILENIFAHPEALNKLRKEIDNKYEELHNPELLPFTETQSLPYLQACVKEGLRLHPATGLPLARVVPEGGATLSGTFFPAGSVIGVNTWVIHRNKDIFGDDADEFKPERWLNQPKEKLSRMENAWIPFGAGSRTCIGKNISLLEIYKLIPVLVRHFSFTMVQPTKTRHENYWLVKQVDMLCRVSPRVSDIQR